MRWLELKHVLWTAVMVGVSVGLWTLLSISSQKPTTPAEQIRRAPRTKTELVRFLSEFDGAGEDWYKLGTLHLADNEGELAREAFGVAERRYLAQVTGPPMSARERDATFVAARWAEIGWLRREQLGQEAGAIEAFREAMEIMQVYCELQPMRNPLYNLACWASLSGERELALDSLERAINAGYRNHDHASTDRDLNAISDEPRFREQMARIDPDRLGGVGGGG